MASVGDPRLEPCKRLAARARSEDKRLTIEAQDERCQELESMLELVKKTAESGGSDGILSPCTNPAESSPMPTQSEKGVDSDDVGSGDELPLHVDELVPPSQSSGSKPPMKAVPKALP